MFCDTLLVFDQVRRQVTAVAYADHSQNGDPAAARAAAESRLDALETQLQQPLPAGLTPLAWKEQDAQALKVVSNTTQSAFENAVRQARDHISAGDVFQLVLSQRLEAEVSHDPFDLYRLSLIHI